MEDLSVVVLAGNRIIEQNRQTAGPNIFTLVAGVPAIERVINTLSSSRRISSILVVGPQKAEKDGSRIMERILAQRKVEYVEPSSGPSESAAKGFMMSDNPVLLTTGDHPLLNVRIVERFVQDSFENNADFIVGLVSHRAVKDSFPESRRTKLQFSDKTFCGSNLFLLKNGKCSNVLNLWTKLETLRKTPWKIVNHFGLLYLIRYKLGMLTTQSAFNVLSRQTDCKVSYVIIDQPRVAIDVDSWEDLSLAERIIGADSASND
jgi:GTP:adenosylcobinamide-phosphate guanylyltransferase